MTRITAAVLFGISFLVASTGPAHATDKAKFDTLIKKYAVDLSDVQSTHLILKGACVCPGASNGPGFLVRADNGTLFCAVPDFDAQGALLAYSSCLTFAVLGK